MEPGKSRSPVEKEEAGVLSPEEVVAVANLIPPTPPPTPKTRCVGSGTDSMDAADSGMNGDKQAAALEITSPSSGTSMATFSNLMILPPLQKQQQQQMDLNAFKQGLVIPLPPLRAEEPVASIRAALAELVQFAHYTRYKLQVETNVLLPSDPYETNFNAKSGAAANHISNNKQRNSNSNKRNSNKGPTANHKDNTNSALGPNYFVPKQDFVSIQYTSSQPFISGTSFMAETATNTNDTAVSLNDYADLSPVVDLLQQYSDETGNAKNTSDHQNGIGFRIVFLRYDAASIREHVARCKSLLDGNPPCVDKLVDDVVDPEPVTKALPPTSPQEEKQEKKAVAGDQQNTTTSIGKEDVDDGGADEEEEEQQKEAKKLKDPRLPLITADEHFYLDGSNLVDFYNLACGENEDLDKLLTSNSSNNNNNSTNGSGHENENKSDVNGSLSKTPTLPTTTPEAAEHTNSNDALEQPRPSIAFYLKEMAKLDAECKMNWRIQYSGFHPPPSHRQMLGDLAYLDVVPPEVNIMSLSDNINGNSNHDLLLNEAVSAASRADIIHITATSTGFYVNKTAIIGTGGRKVFNPSPAEDACYSHSLLDCILQRSEPFRKTWANALMASRERSQLMSLCAASDTPLQSLHRFAMRSMINPLNYGNHHGSSTNIESIIVRPSWIIPFSLDGNNGRDFFSGGNHASNNNNMLPSTAFFNSLHRYNPDRADEDACHTFGLDLRAGSPRDWNEELQVAREMPTATLQERIDRARMIHKSLSDFGEAALLGAKAIFDGSILPMNPNENDRAHVYLHNNIFFSRAVDAGLDTFKVYSGDAAARKSASRDASCTGAIHAMDVKGMYTLGTLLVDYLGTRLVCQSIVPGILHGDKSHTLVYGTVETGSCLQSDKEMHQLVEGSVGETFMIASRHVLVLPLSEKRMEAFASWKENVSFPGLSHANNHASNEEKKEAEKNDMVEMCGPLEVKGIRGSDQRRYLLDVTRLTPRDANWVPISEGGTGHWEKVLAKMEQDKKSAKKAHKYIPLSLDDDELIMAVLRRELVTLFTQKKMTEWLQAKKEKQINERKESAGADATVINSVKFNNEVTNKESKCEIKESVETKVSTEGISREKQIDDEDERYFNSLRFNVNVFLPFTRSLEHVDANAYSQVLLDEEHAREAANFIWETTLPLITQEMRESSGNQVPMDGIALTDMLHSRGVNCRYLGRLAQLAVAGEETDRHIEEKSREGDEEKIPRHTMPLCWLELLECEMVARASKHVLDYYFTMNAGNLASQPASVVASFLSALLSTVEETAAETEARICQQQKQTSKKLVFLAPPEDDELESLVISSIDCEGSACLPSRGEIWESIEAEIGRRYRYTLTLYNCKVSKKENRALHTPLLRRVCQRNGIRLAARGFTLGGKGVCGGGSKGLAATYPISAADVIDIVPTVKHAAALVDGFVPCSFHGGVGAISLQVLLPEAKNAFEAAQLLWNSRAFAQSLEYAQEASALYQRVVDTPLHLNVFRSLELIAAILLHTQEFEMAISNGSHALAVAVQLGGFDSAEAVSAHSSLAYILSSSGNFPAAFKHLRAAIYLMQLLAGPRYSELANFYYRLGTLYSEMVSDKPMNFGLIALRFYKYAMEIPSNDRLFEGMVARSAAMIMALLGQLKAAVDSEKRAYATYRNILGSDHQLTKVSDSYLQHYMKAAVEQGTRLAAESKKRQEEANADAVAGKIKAEEEEKDKKKKKKSGKKKKSK